MLRYDEEVLYKDLQSEANKKGYFVVVKRECYLLYRKSSPRNVMVGSRRHLKDMKYLLNKITKEY